MGTHPIFESDFDCLTDLKMGGTDGGGHAVDSGFGVGWSNNLNEGRHLGKTLGGFMRHKFFHPDSKRNLIIKYIAERRWDEMLKKKDEIEKENARYLELQATRIRHAKGLELDRAKGGVSFLYDEPPTFERWQER